MNVAVEMDAVRQGELLDISEAGPAPKRIIAGFGFWIFLLSDIVMFSALFASYAVLARASAGGMTGVQLFDQRNVAMHVMVGLAWLVFMMVQLSLRGFQDVVVRRLHCFSLFWHALDIIWVLIFTVVYLMGVLP